MIRILALCVLASALATPSMADRMATTDTGQRVLLREDGTWQASPEGDAKVEFDFRRTRWGMSSSEVAKSEPLEDLEIDDLVTGEIGGLVVRVGYVYFDDRLVGGICRLAREHDEDGEFWSDFNKVRAGLIEEHGEPSEHELRWIDDRFKGYPEFQGTAISLGQLAVETRWETERSLVTLVMRGTTRVQPLRISPHAAARSQGSADNLLGAGGATVGGREFHRVIIIDVYYEDRDSSARQAFRDLVYSHR